MRLIDADALMNVIDRKFQEHYGNTVYQFIHDFFRFVIRQIRKAPTIDAVPVVRCKDCKRSEPVKEQPDPLYYWLEDVIRCRCPDLDDPIMFVSDFCSYGARKDGDG